MVSPAHAGVEAQPTSSTSAMERQPRARGGRGAGSEQDIINDSSAPRTRG